jgi:hypothetical protein
MEPTITNGNSSTAVSFPAFVGWNKAAALHGDPAFVGFCVAVPVRYATCFVMKDIEFSTSTTGCVAAYQAGSSGYDFNAAVAQTKPVSVAPHMREAQNDQSFKAQISDISEFGHADLHQGCRVKGRFGLAGLNRPAHSTTGDA